MYRAIINETRDDSHSCRRRLLERGRICKIHSRFTNDGTRKREVIATRYLDYVVALLAMRLAREASRINAYIHISRKRNIRENVRLKVNPVQSRYDNNAKNNSRGSIILKFIPFLERMQINSRFKVSSSLIAQVMNRISYLNNILIFTITKK